MIVREVIGREEDDGKDCDDKGGDWKGAMIGRELKTISDNDERHSYEYISFLMMISLRSCLEFVS